MVANSCQVFLLAEALVARSGVSLKRDQNRVWTLVRLQEKRC